MKKILLIAMSFLSVLMATELPTTITTSVKSVNLTNNSATTAHAIPTGMSGMVIHNYGSGLLAITRMLIAKGGNQATIKPYSVVPHDNLPTIKNEIEAGDRVVFGNFYDNILVIAPNEQRYAQVTSMMNKNWIHPDLYAMYLIVHEQNKITLDNLKAFANENQVGLVFLVDRHEIAVVDPMSGADLVHLPLSGATQEKAQSPFYARFGQVSSGFLGISGSTKFPEYYQGIKEIK